jgi:hypothetical protein
MRAAVLDFCPLLYSVAANTLQLDAGLKVVVGGIDWSASQPPTNRGNPDAIIIQGD